MNNGLTAERMMDSFPLALQKDPKDEWRLAGRQA